MKSHNCYITFLGRKSEAKADILPNGYLQFGDENAGCVYSPEVTPGHKKVIVKLLKQ